MLGSIAGFVFTPLSILLFLNAFQVTKVGDLFGIDILLISAVALIILQVTNVIDSHTEGHSILVTYSMHILCALPSLAYFLSLIVTLPASVTSSFTLIFASFIFIEGIWSLTIFA